MRRGDGDYGGEEPPPAPTIHLLDLYGKVSGTILVC